MNSSFSNTDARRRSLSPSEISDLAQHRPIRWLSDLAVDWSLIVGFFWLFDATGRPWPLLPLFGILIGSRQHALSLLGHDGAHMSALPNRYMNDRLTEWFCGWPLGTTLDGGYRDWHFEHHRALGTPADPELAYRGESSTYSGTITRAHIIARFVQDSLGMGASGLWAFVREILPEKRSSYAGPVLFYALFLVTSLYLDATWVFIVWCWSIVGGFWAVFRMRTWFEHVGLENHGPFGSHRISANPVIRFLFFPHNTHCHFEHHLHPQVPQSNLPELRKRIQARESLLKPVVQPFGELLEQFEDIEESYAKAV